LWPELRKPALHGDVLAVLFVMPVLRRDKLRLQRYDAIMAGRHQGSREHGMMIFSGPVIAFAVRALRAMKFLRSEVLGAVKGDQNTPVEPAKVCQAAPLLELVEGMSEQKEYRIRLNRIQHCADVVVGGDFLHGEQRPAVRPLAALLQRALVGQKGRALHEKNRKRRHPDIDHGIAQVETAAPVWQLLAAAT